MTQTTVPAAETSQDREDASPPWVKRVAMITGVLAGLTGFLSLRGTMMSHQAIYCSTLSVLHQAKASDLYAEYQANSLKRHIDETAVLTGVATGDAAAKLTAEAKLLRQRQDAEKPKADEELKASEHQMGNSYNKLSEKGILDMAGIVAQAGIALASVAALTKRKPAFTMALIIGIIALGITGYGLIISFLDKG